MAQAERVPDLVESDGLQVDDTAAMRMPPSLAFVEVDPSILWEERVGEDIEPTRSRTVERRSVAVVARSTATTICSSRSARVQVASC